MAVGEMVFYSREMNRNTHFRFIIPEGPNPFDEKSQQYYKRPTKTLILLHGHGNGNEEWITSSRIKELACRYNFAVMMPNGENSFYLNHPEAKTYYMNYVGQELPDYARRLFGLSDERENTAIGGISMGGFGALHTGLAFPETFSHIFAFSSALILYDVVEIKPDHEDGFGGYAYYTSIFGPLDQVMESDTNPEQLVLKIQQNRASMPGIFMTCGTEDFLLEKNRRFRAFLEEHQVPVTYREGSGNHDFQYWNPCLEEAMQWMA